MSLRGMFMGLLLAAFAGSAGAADKSFKMEGGDTLRIKGGEDWVVGDQIPESPFGTITLHGADKTKWRLTIAPLPPHPTLTGDTGNLRIYVIGASRVWSNVATAHQAFVPLLLVVPGIAAGNHTVQLVHFDGFSDVNDYYSVTVMELPF